MEKEKEKEKIIRKNIIQTLENIKKSYEIDCEIHNITFFLEKYSDLFFEYSEHIFSSFMTFFKKIAFCDKNAENRDKFYLKYCEKECVQDKLINIIFSYFFKEKNYLLCEENIGYLCRCLSGIRIINIYLYFGGKFSKNETKIIFDEIGKSIIYNLYIALKNTVNNNINSFYYDKELIEYASFIPVINYTFNYIKKKKNITNNTINNLLSYSQNNEIYDYILENFELSDDMLFSVCKSLNINLIIKFLNKKININNNIITKILTFYDNKNTKNTKFINFKSNKLVYFENYENTNCNFVRIININEITKYYEIIKYISNLFINYGYYLDNGDIVKFFENGIIIEKINHINFNNETKRKFLDLCVKKNNYPYFINDKYPPPDILCLYEECKKKTNLNTIKKICEEIIEPNIECLKIACSLDNNMSVLKYFIDKKKIVPNIECIKNSIKNEINNDLLRDENKFINYMLNNGSCMTKYLCSKYLLLHK